MLLLMLAFFVLLKHFCHPESFIFLEFFVASARTSQVRCLSLSFRSEIHHRRARKRAGTGEREIPSESFVPIGIVKTMTSRL